LLGSERNWWGIRLLLDHRHQAKDKVLKLGSFHHSNLLGGFYDGRRYRLDLGLLQHASSGSIINVNKGDCHMFGNILYDWMPFGTFSAILAVQIKQ
jgi:hypothetical protein